MDCLEKTKESHWFVFGKSYSQSPSPFSDNPSAFLFYNLMIGVLFAVFFLNFSSVSHQFAGLHLP